MFNRRQKPIEINTGELERSEQALHSTDVALFAKNCNDAFARVSENPEVDVAVITLSHIDSLQRMWLPSEFTALQAEAHKAAEEHEVHRRFDEAQAEIAAFNEILRNDPMAIAVRVRAVEELRAEINEAHRPRFDKIVGYITPAEVKTEASQTTGPIRIMATKAVSSARWFGDMLVGAS